MTSIRDLHNLLIHNITPKAFILKADEFMRVSALEDGETDPDDIVCEVCRLDRFDILEAMKDHLVFGKLATEELNIKQFLDHSRRDWATKVSQYPPLFKEMREIVYNSPKMGIYDLSYPSLNARDAGLGNNYFAISGDGLFMFMFEIVSMEGRGQFKLAPRPEQFNIDSSGKKNPEGEDVLMFKAHTGANYGELLTGDDVIAGLKGVYCVVS